MESLREADFSMEPRIIPVLDIMGGQVVRGVAGQRGSYKPIVSRIVESPQPLDVASSFKRLFNITELYIADLDAIESTGSNQGAIEEIVNTTQLEIMLDSGVQSIADVKFLLDIGIQKVVIATETMDSIDVIHTALEQYPKAIVGSLDLKAGKLMCFDPQMAKKNPLQIAIEFENAGLKDLIVLDLALVGTGKGPIHNALIDICKGTSMNIIAGGGVRDRTDLVSLGKLGVKAALIATALHNGNISPDKK